VLNVLVQIAYKMGFKKKSYLLKTKAIHYSETSEIVSIIMVAARVLFRGAQP
jgi:hypothetical protein